MGEYGREQRNQLSRVIANSKLRGVQLKIFVDNRSKANSFINNSLVRNRECQTNKNIILQAKWGWNRKQKDGEAHYCYPDNNNLDTYSLGGKFQVDATNPHITKFGKLDAKDSGDHVTLIHKDTEEHFNYSLANGYSILPTAKDLNDSDVENMCNYSAAALSDYYDEKVPPPPPPVVTRPALPSLSIVKKTKTP